MGTGPAESNEERRTLPLRLPTRERSEGEPWCEGTRGGPQKGCRFVEPLGRTKLGKGPLGHCSWEKAAAERSPVCPPAVGAGRDRVWGQVFSRGWGEPSDENTRRHVSEPLGSAITHWSFEWAQGWDRQSTTPFWNSHNRDKDKGVRLCTTRLWKSGFGARVFWSWALAVPSLGTAVVLVWAKL